MGVLNANYGSELHLLRWMGRHRNALIAKIKAKTGLVDLDLLPFGFSKGEKSYDTELKCLSFLSNAERRSVNKTYCSSIKPNWDAVGIGKDSEGHKVYVLIEAKAHLNEIYSGNWHGGNSHDVIAKALGRVAKEITCDSDLGELWMGQYYQLANRIYVQKILEDAGVKSVLVDIFFCGDRNPEGICPSDSSGWRAAIDKEYKELHLNTSAVKKYLSCRLLELFIDVRSEKDV